MSNKKIDKRIQFLIENGTVEKHRTMFVVIGANAKEQIPLLHHMQLKSTAAEMKPSTVLWCSKKELGFSRYQRKKHIKSIKNKIKVGKLDVEDDNPFELFVVSNNIRYCYYNETQNVLGMTYDMCILQDFEALTPNILARTIETVEGGGLIIILLQSVNSLKQLYRMNMDVHERYRTEAHQKVVGRFNERFVLSLASCKRCLVVDDNLRVLPITLQNLDVKALPKGSLVEKKKDFIALTEYIHDNKLLSMLLNCCKTVDQAKALLKFIEIISEKKFNSTVSLTAARGRGKSATLGLAIAGALLFGYSNIYISSPSPENLNTLFTFIFRGLDVFEYKEYSDYNFVQSTNAEFNRAIIKVNIFRNHRQTVQYIHPSEIYKLNNPELLVIDEAAAIPLPYIKSMLGSYLIFLSSTINGYEGTGRSLSLKLLQQLRMQMQSLNSNEITTHMSNANKVDKEIKRQLHELTLGESIRYQSGDEVEQWLNNTLCLDASLSSSISSNCPSLDTCQLYYINRETLFSYHETSEQFLQRLVALNVASHYKNSPNDLQMMSDAPAHHLFCLLGPINSHKALPEILVVIQVCFEGGITKQSIIDGLGRGQRAPGDLIPWTIAQQYQDSDFGTLYGVRIVRITAHPDYQCMGYGTRALQLLRQYYEMKIQSLDKNSVENIIQNTCIDDRNLDPLLDDTIAPRVPLPPLLLKLSERPPEKLDYLGVSFGLTESLLKFWKRSNFVLCYLRQTPNDITGEHSCIMLSRIRIDKNEKSNWLEEYWMDFRRRFIMLLSYSFISYSPLLALNIVTNNTIRISCTEISRQVLDVYFTLCDFRRLQMYSDSIVDYHLIMDLLPTLAKSYFLNLINNIHFSPIQLAILIGLGFQHKTIDKVAEELNLPTTQVLGLFNRIVWKFTQYLNGISKDLIKKPTIAVKLINNGAHIMEKNGNETNYELNMATDQIKMKQRKRVEYPQNNLNKDIKKSKNSNDDTTDNKNKLLMSTKNGKKRRNSLNDTSTLRPIDSQKKKKVKGS